MPSPTASTTSLIQTSHHPVSSNQGETITLLPGGGGTGVTVKHNSHSVARTSPQPYQASGHLAINQVSTGSKQGNIFIQMTDK